MHISEMLHAQQDLKFRDFQARLLPSMDKTRILGVKTAALKQLAKELARTGEAEALLRTLPHTYFEEDQIHAFLISEMRDFERARTELELFLPYVNNWATCDQMILKSIAKDPTRVMESAELWLTSEHEYTVRFGIGIWMRYFLDSRFQPAYLERIAQLRREEYYIQTMVAWYFATALTKQYEAALPYVVQRRLSAEVHKLTIRKACESLCIPQERKELLKTLR